MDSIIWRTESQADFGYLERCSDPTSGGTSMWEELPGSRSRSLPRLYQNIFSLQHADSQAVISYVTLPAPAFLAHDLASMALAQVWEGAILDIVPGRICSSDRGERVEVHFARDRSLKGASVYYYIVHTFSRLMLFWPTKKG